MYVCIYIYIDHIDISKYMAVVQNYGTPKFDFCTLILQSVENKMKLRRRMNLPILGPRILREKNGSPIWSHSLWATVESGGFAFREHFADLSRTFRGFLAQKMQFQKLMFMQGWLL